MSEQERDPQLGSPQEANTGKHINFLEAEENNSKSERSADTDEESPTKKAWDEMRRDSKSEQSESDG